MKKGGLFVPLAAALELAVALACGGIVADDQDTNAGQDVDTAADVEPEEVAPDAVEDATPDVPEVVDVPDIEETTDVLDVVEDAPPEEDVEDTPDAVDVEDEGSEVEDAPEAESSDGEEADAEEAEDSGPEAESTDAADAREAADEGAVEDAHEDGRDGETGATEDAGEDGAEADGDAAEADSPECTPTVHSERGGPLEGADPIYGSTQEITPIYEISEWSGTDCGEPTSRLIQLEVMLYPPLDETNLGHARGRMTVALNGEEVISTLTPTSLRSATAVVPCMEMHAGDETHPGDTIDGEPDNFKASLLGVSSGHAVFMPFNKYWESMPGVVAYGTGEVALDPESTVGLIATDFNEADGTVRACRVWLPAKMRSDDGAGGGEALDGDGRWFYFNTDMAETPMQEWLWNWWE